MKKSRSKFLKIVDEKHDINFHWPNFRNVGKLPRCHIRHIVYFLSFRKQATRLSPLLDWEMANSIEIWFKFA
jgi:hypothetical protein